MQAALRRQAGRADHLDRRQQRLRRGDQGRARRRASSSSPSMSTTPRAPRAMRARPSSARASSRPAIRWPRRMSKNFPKDGPITCAGRRLGARARTGPSSARRRDQVPRGVQGGESRTARSPSRRSTPAPTSPSRRDRVGAYLNAHPDTTAYFDTGFWHAGVARVLADRGVAPGKVLLGGFDLVPEVLQQMKSGLHPGAGRPAALHAGLHAGDGGLSRQDRRAGARPTSTPARASCARTRSIRSWTSRPRACAELAAGPARARGVRRAA